MLLSTQLICCRVTTCMPYCCCWFSCLASGYANTRHKAKLSSAELMNSFIWFKPQQTSIELFLSEKQSSTHKQPFLLCMGNKENPDSFYLILDVKAIALGDCGVLRAVDALFKAHYVYWVGYAMPSVWNSSWNSCRNLSTKLSAPGSPLVSCNCRTRCWL